MVLVTLSLRNRINFCSISIIRKSSSLITKRKRSPIDVNMKCRENPVVLKVDSPQFKSIFTPEVYTLKNIFDKYAYEIRIAGGAVRDILMGKIPKDLDFATTATPDEMKEMFNKEEVRMINTNGEKHGTISPRINDKENFEVTTLRIDMVTDGRHADVQFTTDWKLDSNRRDLTINSMFLGFDGSVYDYFFGYEDLMAKRVVFVGCADTRIKEDYLRILRYFRFFGCMVDKPDSHDDNTLSVINRNVEGLERISGERIWMEVKKILEGNHSGDILKTMLHVGVGKYIGLPENSNLTELDRVWTIGKETKLQAITLLSSLLNDLEDAMQLHSRLKFSGFDRDLAFFIVANREEVPSSKPLLRYQKILLNTPLKHAVCREYICELLKYTNKLDLLSEFKNWTAPKFPISGADLMAQGVVSNRKLIGNILSRLKDYWAEHDFDVPQEELLDLVNEYNAIEEEKFKLRKLSIENTSQKFKKMKSK